MLRFSIRDLLWLTTVIGLTCGLIVTWSALANRQRLLDKQIKRAEQLEGDLAQSHQANVEMFERLRQMTRVNAIRDTLNSIPPAKPNSN